MSNPVGNEDMGIHNMNSELSSVKKGNNTGQSSLGKLPQTSDADSLSELGLLLSTLLIMESGALALRKKRED